MTEQRAEQSSPRRQRPAPRLWGSIVLTCVVAFTFVEVLRVLRTADSLLLRRTWWGIANDLSDRIVVMAAAGAVVGTGLAIIVTLTLQFMPAERRRQHFETADRAAVNAAIFGCAAFLMKALLDWAMVVGLLRISIIAEMRLWLVLCALGLLAAPLRFLRERGAKYLIPVPPLAPTRRVVIASGAAAAVVAAIGQQTGAAAPRSARRSSGRGRPSYPNVMLITFDALSAEDMSLYGYRLPTTPSIDAFAERASVFSNFYACSTFTTPSIAAIETGRYLTSTGIYHIQDRLEGDAASETLVGTLRAAGYMTAASVCNPWAHPERLGCGRDYNLLPAPAMPLFAVPALLLGLRHSDVFDEAWTASRVIPRLMNPTSSLFRPRDSFAQGQSLLDRLEPPYFLRMHIFAPHSPYQPTPPFLHRFLATDEFRTTPPYWDITNLPDLGYTPDRQPSVDRARLRYDEWVAETDAAFGEFITRFERRADSDNCIVVVSADHGESFEGGVFSHGSSRQRRPIIHVPLVLRLPSQSTARRIETAADQTALAATILDLVGLPRPPWIDGRSLRPLLEGAGRDATGFAFTQYLAANAIGRPLDCGTVGVVDGHYQYVIDLATRAGTLRRLTEAHFDSPDLSAADPEIAASLRQTIGERFPHLSRIVH